MRNSPLEWVDVQPFIWRRQYAALRDPVATARGDLVRNIEIALLLGIAALLLVAVVLDRLTTGS